MDSFFTILTFGVAASDLMPEVNKEVGPRMALLVFAGVLLFYLAEHLLSRFGV